MVDGSGTETLAGVNLYTGATTIGSGETLALSGSGSIAASSGVADGGTFDISNANSPGASITTLSAAGGVNLGSKTLTLTAGVGTYSGVIAAGTGGVMIDGSGTETLAGVNLYSGTTTIGSGETLALSGSGSIAASSGVADGGTFDISNANSPGASITTLSGAGGVNLGSKTLTLTKGAGTYSGVIAASTGGLTVDNISPGGGGTETLTGHNLYSGATTIGSGETLALSGLGSIAASSGVVDSGTFSISGTTSGASITTLSGAGGVNLGSNTLTLTAGTGVYLGVIAASTGGLTVDGSGTETLTGHNLYSGTTTIGSGETLALSGLGSIAASSGVVISNNGTLDLSSATSTGFTPTISFSGGATSGAVDIATTQSTYSLTVQGSSWSDTSQILDFTGLSATGDSLTHVGNVYTLKSGAYTVTITVSGTFTGTLVLNNAGGHPEVYDPPAAPAGVAGSPISLALANPSGAQGTLLTATITGVPSDWTLNEGTNLGNGTWAVETDDLSALTVLTAAAYAGAALLGVSESWANADGSTAVATLTDNVEAYATGNPVFALSGDDHLTGAGANDLFVVAQPIGNDTIYNFNAASDKIDLVGFANVASFSDIQGHIAGDGSGDTVITIGSGETITLDGMSPSSLTANDFVFNQMSTVENSGIMTVSDGATLPLGGTVDNTGTITLNSTGDATELQIIGDGVTLTGGGHVALSNSAENMIVGTNPGATFTNVDNTISGAGQIGAGDGNLTLVNEAHGTIDANVAGGVLTLDTGSNIITNFGTLEASNGGELAVHSAVDNSGGVVEALSGGHIDFLGAVTGGNATIAGGNLEFDAASNVSVTFNNGTGYGELTLDDPSGFTGQITGFTGTAADQAHSDAIDLAGINYHSSDFSEAFNTSTDALTVSDGGDTVSLTFDNFDATLSFASDGNGGTLITDPPASVSTNSATAWGMKFGNDSINHSEHSGGATGSDGPSVLVSMILTMIISAFT